MATGGTASIAGSASGTNYTEIFNSTTDTGGGCTTFGVGNSAESAGPCYVFVANIHTSAEPMTLEPGDKWLFRNGLGGKITSVKVKGDGTNAATVNYGVLVR